MHPRARHNRTAGRAACGWLHQALPELRAVQQGDLGPVVEQGEVQEQVEGVSLLLLHTSDGVVQVDA